jgi:hypothetical protein
MLDQGNTCGGFRRQKLVQVRGRRAITQAFAFSHALLKPGMGDAMGVSQIRSRVKRPGFDGQNVWRRSSAPIPLGRARTPAFGHLA